MARRRAPAEKKSGLSKVPFMAWVLGIAGTAAAVRAFWHPARAIVKSGEAASCPGPDGGGVCNATIVVKATPGEPVFSVGAGHVVSSGPTWTHIELNNEAILLYYAVATELADGKRVGRGQKIGVVPSDGLLEFGVWEVTTQGVVPIEPASWLAARGYKLATKLTGDGTDWCEQSRRILVPKSAHQTCGLKLPEAASFGLLPVSIQQE